ncbi:putative multi-domain containing protein [Aduncisulcus paluster]|uniref:UDP-N-acetylglucosamine diphosphorylase n=1 Tax=Aduncisulcus paluster TaxID=2918883 RepID=A0ABQ5K6W4_9EUKA|nr:putative multi-domain containing protein [Aduncisulcus paluster]
MDSTATLKDIPSQYSSLVDDSKREMFYELGLNSLLKKEFALLILAGGLGTRLGAFGSKGIVKIGLKSDLSLFGLMAAKIKALQTHIIGSSPPDSCRSFSIPWVILTSSLSHESIINHFKTQKFFGLEKHQIIFIMQGQEVCSDFDGNPMKISPTEPSISPNGNGGVFGAMRDSDLFSTLEERGFPDVKYFQFIPVDNILVHPCYIEAVGMAIQNDIDFVNVCVQRSNPSESVGYCAMRKIEPDSELHSIKKALGIGPSKSTSTPCIVEYSHMSEADKTRANVRSFPWANICIHVISRRLLNTIFDYSRAHKPDGKDILYGGALLPYHSARKAIPYWDKKEKKIIKPSIPNGIKREMFLFDILNAVDISRFGVYEVKRDDAFAPLKSKEDIKPCLSSLSSYHHSVAQKCGIRLKVEEQFDPASFYDLKDLQYQRRRFDWRFVII